MSTLNLMLVDDEERFLSTTAKLLQRKGHQVTTATSGQEALEKLATQDVEVVILDVKMPGMDGLTVLHEIRVRFPLIGVIMLTGHGTIESAVQGMKSGAFDFITKPCDIDELLAKAEEAASRRRDLEDRIRKARLMTAIRSPRELVREADGKERK
ncbi:MAG: response regulator [Thermoanaerobaculales bacterium]|jgi:DNA-binding NtrC family response regulator|nr:response regulator [Thermoanaerobaculales bacterium]